MKTGGRLVKHGRYYWLFLAEGHLTRRLSGTMLRRIRHCRSQQAEAWRVQRNSWAKKGLKGRAVLEKCLGTGGFRSRHVRVNRADGLPGWKMIRQTGQVNCKAFNAFVPRKNAIRRESHLKSVIFKKDETGAAKDKPSKRNEMLT